MQFSISRDPHAAQLISSFRRILMQRYAVQHFATPSYSAVQFSISPHPHTAPCSSAFCHTFIQHYAVQHFATPSYSTAALLINTVKLGSRIQLFNYTTIEQWHCFNHSTGHSTYFETKYKSFFSFSPKQLLQKMFDMEFVGIVN